MGRVFISFVIMLMLISCGGVTEPASQSVKQCLPENAQTVYSLDMAFSVTDGKMAILDTTGALVTDYSFDDLVGIQEGFCIARIDSTYFVVDRYGKMTSDKYDGFQPLFNGTAAVKKEDRYGLVSTQGRELLPPLYDLPALIPISAGVLENVLAMDEMFWDDILSQFEKLASLCAQERSSAHPSPDALRIRLENFKQNLEKGQGSRMTDRQIEQFNRIVENYRNSK